MIYNFYLQSEVLCLNSCNDASIMESQAMLMRVHWTFK